MYFHKIDLGTNQANYVRVMSDKGCYSYLGMIGGEQVLSIQADGCAYIGIVAHEFIHALGINFTFMLT